MQNHFKVAGDFFDPTKLEEINLDMIEIKNIHEEYTAFINSFFYLAGLSILSYGRFCWLVRKAFSFVKIRARRLQKRKFITFNIIHFHCVIFRIRARVRNVAQYLPFDEVLRALISAH